MNKHINMVITMMELVMLGYIAGAFVLGGLIKRYSPAIAQTARSFLSGAGMPAYLGDRAIATLAPVDPDDDPAQGPADAPITIIEFSDYQCVFCRILYQETLQPLLAQYGDRVRYVYRDFPLMRQHPQAMQAVMAAECAHDQDRYWAYHDLLYGHQQALEVDDLKGYAQELGLNRKMFDACLDEARYAQEVDKDFLDGLSHGVIAAPTLFINGVQVTGAVPLDVLRQIIDQALQDAR
ncbi:MAG: DsbA family protein [Anaerolineae bacterium]